MTDYLAAPGQDWSAADRYAKLRAWQRAELEVLSIREAKFLARIGLGLLVALTVFSWAYVELLTWEPFR